VLNINSCRKKSNNHGSSCPSEIELAPPRSPRNCFHKLLLSFPPDVEDNGMVVVSPLVDGSGLENKLLSCVSVDGLDVAVTLEAMRVRSVFGRARMALGTRVEMPEELVTAGDAGRSYKSCGWNLRGVIKDSGDREIPELPLRIAAGAKAGRRKNLARAAAFTDAFV